MFNKLLMGTAVLSLAASMAFGAQGVRFNVAAGDKEHAYNTMVNEKIESVGFILSKMPLIIWDSSPLPMMKNCACF